MITLVHPSNVRAMLQPVTALLESVANRRGYTVEKILEPVLEMNAELWVVGQFDGVVVTQIIQRPLERILWVDWLAGENAKDWLPEWEEVQRNFAQKAGCTAVEFSGRLGWKKYQDVADFKPIATLYRQELSDGERQQ